MRTQHKEENHKGHLFKLISFGLSRVRLFVAVTTAPPRGAFGLFYNDPSRPTRGVFVFGLIQPTGAFGSACLGHVLFICHIRHIIVGLEA